MKKASEIAVCVVVMLVLVEASMAVICIPTELISCAGAMSSPSTAPSKLCCTKLAEQTPCFCKYLKDPMLKDYVNSPNAQKVALTCGVPTPKCN